jgi:hypothetical protein
VLVALSAAGVALVAVLAEVLGPRIRRRWALRRKRVAGPAKVLHDPGRELRAEQRARALLRSCVNQEEWEMYRDLGFLRVKSNQILEQAYLVYPQRPIMAFVPATRQLVAEYCVTFEDHEQPYGSGQLPDSDDVLAKWMALTGDERRLISSANMHLPGRQLDPEQVERDLQRLTQWEQARARRAAYRTGDDIDTPRLAPTPVAHTPTPSAS